MLFSPSTSNSFIPYSERLMGEKFLRLFGVGIFDLKTFGSTRSKFFLSLASYPERALPSDDFN